MDLPLGGQILGNTVLTYIQLEYRLQTPVCTCTCPCTHTQASQKTFPYIIQICLHPFCKKKKERYLQYNQLRDPSQFTTYPFSKNINTSSKVYGFSVFNTT